MRPLQHLLLSVALALAASACGSPEVYVQNTQAALDAIVAEIEALDGVLAVRKLGPDDSSGFPSATVVASSVALESDVDDAGAARVVEQVAELIWNSEVATIDMVFVDASGLGTEGYVTLYEVLGDTSSDGLRAHFGERR